MLKIVKIEPFMELWYHRGFLGHWSGIILFENAFNFWSKSPITVEHGSYDHVFYDNTDGTTFFLRSRQNPIFPMYFTTINMTFYHGSYDNTDDLTCFWRSQINFNTVNLTFLLHKSWATRRGLLTSPTAHLSDKCSIVHLRALGLRVSVL